MTIPKISSQDLNEVLAKAKNEIHTVKDKMENIKNDLKTKLKIMTYESDYMNCELCNLKNGAYIRSNNLKTFNKYCEGVYNLYGSTVTSDFIKKPVNLFNMQTSTSGEVFFRNDVNVSINGSANKYNLNILKHDSLEDKEISFYELDHNELTLEITMDSQNQLGPARFNMIEIDPFLPGSFDIESILIFYKNQDGTTVVSPKTYTEIKSVGKQRILLNKKYDLYKIIFKIKLNYVMNKNDINTYPFGLKHLYLFDADFKSDSYVIATVDRQQYISIIRDEIYMLTSTGEYISTLDKEKIEVYSTYTKGNLEDRIYPSTALERNEIARNINTLYIKIPLKPNQALIGVGFYVETKKQSLFYDSNNVIYIDRIIRDNGIEGPTYSKIIPHDMISVPNNFTEDTTKKKDKQKTMTTYNTLPGFGKINNLFEHRISEGFTLHSDIDIPFDDISINSNNVCIIKTSNNEKINAILENDKDKCNLIIKPVYPLDYDCQYSIYFKDLLLSNGVKLPNYKADFTTEDYDINIYDEKLFVPTLDCKVKVELNFEPDEEYFNDKFIYIVDKNSNKIPSSAQYNNGYLIVSAKTKLQEKQTYHIYIKKGVRNSKLQKTLIKTIKQTFVTGVNEYSTLDDKLFVPIGSNIEVKVNKAIDITNKDCDISKCIFILDNNHRKVACDIDYDSDFKLLKLSPRKALKNNSQHLLIISEETPVRNPENSTFGKTVAQKIFTRNENLAILEMSNEKNIEFGRFSVPATKYDFVYEFQNTFNVDTINKNNIIVLDEYYNIINYKINIVKDNTIAVRLEDLSKDSRYYIVFNDSILNMNGNKIISGLMIFTIITENSGIDLLTEKFLIPNDKIFSVNTGSTIGQECLNNKYIYVIDEQHRIVPTLINQPINGCLSIKPPDERYSYWSKYAIVIDKSIKDNRGISLLKPQVQYFNTVDSESNVQYSTINDINDNYVFNIEMPSNVPKEYLTSDYVYIVDSDYNKLNNINIEYGAKDGDILSNIIRISPMVGTTYPIGNLKLVISKDIKTSSMVNKKTKIIMFKTISPQ